MGKAKLAQARLICIVLLCQLLMCSSDVISHDTEDELSTSERKIKEHPIVIHTQQQQYDQPTLNEYQECHENLDNCMRVCESAEKRTACEAECPTCPLLINHDVVVQGINDTDYRPETPITALNTTNIIRLTNEIHNVVENNMGNVTAHNVNNIQVHNNVSTTGGRFGLGYNERGACCLVVRAKKHCSNTKLATASRCHQKRLRVCGERCKARVMYAHRERYCNEANPNDCHMRMQYVPYALHASHRTSPAARERRSPRCHYKPVWPFVACGATGGCQRCMQLSYGYILQHGVPERCVHCYRARRYDLYDTVLPQFYDYGQPTYVDWDNEPMDMGDNDEDGNVYEGADIDDAGSGWHVTKKKCRGPDDTIVDCNDSALQQRKNDESFVDEDEIIDDAVDETPEGTFETTADYEDAYVDSAEVEAERYRRHTLHKRLSFQPSSYSKRHHKQQIIN